MPKVWNKRRIRGIPTGAVYVGRPTKWGNPFSHLPDTAAAVRVATREQAVARYRTWVLRTYALADIQRELGGKDLICWCAPLACHADVLLELANLPESDN